MIFVFLPYLRERTGKDSPKNGCISIRTDRIRSDSSEKDEENKEEFVKSKWLCAISVWSKASCKGN